MWLARFAIWTDGYAVACGKSTGSTGRPPPPDGTTCGYAVSPSATPANGAAAARDTGGLPAPGSSTWLCPTPTGITLASRPSAKPGSVSPKRLDEPPDAGPHVRWCERGRGDPAPYSILLKGYSGNIGAAEAV